MAQQAATDAGMNRVSAMHLLHGILKTRNDPSNAGRMFGELGIDLDALETASALASAGQWPPPPVDGVQPEILLDPAALASITAGVRAATQLGHDRVGTEHLLVGLLEADTNSEAARLLSGAGLTAGACRGHIVGWLAAGTYTREPADAPPPGFASAAVARRGRPGLVWRIRSIAQTMYMFWVLIVCFGPVLVRSSMFEELELVLSDLWSVFVLFIIGYFVSSWLLSLLLNARVARNRVHVPPGEFAVMVETQFGLSCAGGVLVTAAAVPLVGLAVAVAVRDLALGPSMYIDELAIVTLVLIAVSIVVTHWLLTFNIRGPAVPTLSART
jgi:uncharacterized membrane protein YwzB